MKTEAVPFEKQIFVCTNDMKGEKVCCGDQNGPAIFRALRNIAKQRGLHPRIRVAQATCLGYCGQGCNVMVYPDNVWHTQVTEEDVEFLAKTYLSID
ncbi:MAG: (2Fe-2S) ferredoxin domain-containing protein [Candidatus Omnitrophica bacterium]|nr:(2Fe-2S) ferredoxin domain-containing protein [Candidatus Omnitrophota bacterium]